MVYKKQLWQTVTNQDDFSKKIFVAWIAISIVIIFLEC